MQSIRSVFAHLLLGLVLPASLWAQGTLENPQPGSFQSGIGLVSGWVCEASQIDIVIDEAATVQAAYGTERADTVSACGDADNGFGLLLNWNLLGDGEHTVRALADGEEFASVTITVTTFGVEFLRGASGSFTLEDFPEAGTDITIQWQQSLQNFVIIQVHREFHIPPAMTGTRVEGKMTYNLVMQPGMTQFIPGAQTATFGYNGSYLGPTLVMNKGDEVVLNVTNNLGTSTTTHWHGFHLPAIMDGGPHQMILDGETWRPTFTILNRASTYWYHPHLHAHNGIRDPNGTSGQVFRGLAGMIIVGDEESEQLVLPKEYGVDDIPLIIQDRSFNPDGSFLEFPINLPGPLTPGVVVNWPLRKGDKFLVNGVISPELETPAQMIRFRILNASNVRTYNLGFSDNRTFYQIGSDGGLLEAPLPLTRLIVTPAERMDIVVDFGNDENTTVRMRSYNSELVNYLSELLKVDDFDRTDFDIFTIAVGAPTENPVTTLPTSLTSIERIPAEEAVNADQPRPFELSMDLEPIPPFPEVPETLEITGMINGKVMELSRIDEVIQLGNTEIWEITNAGLQVHPFHVHGDSFQVLSRNGSIDNVPANERGWKDTVQVLPGDTVQIIKRFEDFADPVWPYMFHCHILDHEDAGMMGQWIVDQR